MAVTFKGNNGTYEGTSEDNKPLDVPVNTEFNELDTGKTYYFDGETWNEEPPCEGGGFTPTETQLVAMNSGIDSEKVEQIATNENNILSKAITGTCNTASATDAKEVTIDGFELVKGAIIGVKYANTNSAANVTLNVNSTGAKSIYHNNEVYTGVSYQICGKKDTYTYYMYDGTYWCWLAIGENTAPAHLITTNTATSITITGLDSTYNTNCLLLCTDRRTSDAVDSVYFVSRYGTAVRISVLSGNTTPSATISGDVITISGLRTYQTITALAAETVGISTV